MMLILSMLDAVFTAIGYVIQIISGLLLLIIGFAVWCAISGEKRLR